MKKLILIELFLVLFFCTFISFSVIYFQGYMTAASIESEIFRQLAINNIIEALLLLLCAILDLSVIIVIAIFPLPGSKPIIEKLSAWSAAYKTVRFSRKEKRLKKLESKLDRLKEDE